STSGVSGTDAASRAPSVAYLSGTLFVAWQQEAPLLPTDIYAARYSGGAWSAAGAGALSAGGVSHSTGIAMQPRLAANGGKLHLTWADTPLQFQTNPGINIYARVWDGTDFIEEVPGDASYQGIGQASAYSRTLALSVDGIGHPFVAWDDIASGTAAVYVRGNTLDLHQLFMADSATTIQSILDSQSLGRGDVIAVKPATIYSLGLSIGSADAGVLILGAPDGTTIIQGAVNISGTAGVMLQRLTINGGIISNNSDGLALIGNIIRAGGLTLNGGADVRVVGNSFSGTVGVRFAAPATGYIARNSMRVTTTGMDIAANFTGLIYGNDISGASTGISYAAPSTLSANQIHGGTTGVNITATGEAFGLGYVGIARANQIYGNQTGVTVASGARVRGQHIYNNATGVAGSGVLGGNDLDTANLIEGNTIGVNFTGTIQFNRIASNGTGITVNSGQAILHNLIYRNTQTGILIAGDSDVRVISNTIYSPLGDSVRVQGASSNVEIR
ncbi:MAG TPA: NosD domain-containing protein, partial [Candidatus Dormibacteraeota bacterium]|nr:NosD domain-containing protein [Candidatus Dormibacteraeota bacterium]